MSFCNSVSAGCMSRAICCISSDVSASSRLKKRPEMRFSSTPWRSSGTMVLRNVGLAGLFTMASISARTTAMAVSNAGA